VLLKQENDFLETVLPLRVFATLTTARRFSEERLRYAFDEWILEIQAHQRFTLGWVRSVEIQPKPHIHAALVAACALDSEYAATLWQRMVAPRYLEAAKIEPYRRNLCGLSYILKQLPDSGERIQFSENLAAFAINRGPSCFLTTSAQRRQERRIRAQIGDHSRNPLQ
jgi:hypothetical protein